MPIIDIKHLSASPLGAPWLEVGDSSTLEVVPKGDVHPDKLVFSSSNPHVASISESTITGVGFGVTTLSASDDSTQQVVARLTLYVGSVVILGADGNSWRVFPDGACKQVLPGDIAPRIRVLEHQRFLFADVGNQKISDATKLKDQPDNLPVFSPTAVTCYLLNLEAIAKQNKKQG